MAERAPVVSLAGRRVLVTGGARGLGADQADVPDQGVAARNGASRSRTQRHVGRQAQRDLRDFRPVRAAVAVGDLVDQRFAGTGLGLGHRQVDCEACFADDKNIRGLNSRRDGRCFRGIDRRGIVQDGAVRDR